MSYIDNKSTNEYVYVTRYKCAPDRVCPMMSFGYRVANMYRRSFRFIKFIHVPVNS